MGCSNGIVNKNVKNITIAKAKLEEVEKNINNIDGNLKILKEAEILLAEMNGKSAEELKINCYLKLSDIYFKKLDLRNAKSYLDKAKSLGCINAEKALEKFKNDDFNFTTKYFISEEESDIFFEYSGIINLNNTREFNWIYNKTIQDKEIKSILDLLRNQIGQEFINKDISDEGETKEILELFKTDIDGNFSKLFIHRYAKKMDPNLYDPKAFIFIGKLLKFTKFKTNLPEQLLNDLLKLTFSNNENIRVNDSDLIYRLEAISTLLSVMADLNLSDIPKVDHDKFYNLLCDIVDKSQNSKIKFLANFTKQALVRVPNDESKMQSFFRRFSKFAQGVNNLRGAVNDKDPSKLLNAWSCFKISFDFQQAAQLWYDELKYAQFLIECKNLKLFEYFLYTTGVETKKNQNFSMGIIYEIVELVKNEDISLKNKESALNLLHHILISENWSLNNETKIEILRSLNYFRYLNATVYDDLKKLLASNEELNNLFILNINSESYSDDNFSLKSRLISEAIVSLTKNPDFCKIMIKQSRLLEYESEENKKYNSLYTPARCRIPEVKVEKCDLQPLIKVVEDGYLKSSCKIMVIMGNSGSGKSMFLKYLENHLLKNNSDYFPIYIKLPQYIKDFDSDKLLYKYYLEHNMTGLSHLIEKEKILFLFDGYDEIPRQRNIYDFNNLKKLNKNSKIIITCREEILLPDFKAHKSEFVPEDNEKLLYEPRQIEKFNNEEIEHFLDAFLRNKQIDEDSSIANLTKQEYLSLFKKLNLIELVSNPLTLYIVADVLPGMVNENIVISKFNLYQTFVQRIIQKEIKRNDEFQKSLRDYENNMNINSESKSIMLRFQITVYLAILMYRNNQSLIIDNNLIYGHLVSRFKIPDNSKCKFAILRSLPLCSSGNNCSMFIHKSLYEFFIADGLISEINKGVEESDIINMQTIEYEVIQFLAEKVTLDKILEQKLWNIIDKTKIYKILDLAGSNAASILNHSKIIFKNRNLEGVNIPYADLSNSVITNCNFKNSNLKKVNFASSYIGNCKFDGSDMSQVNFSQFPNLNSNHEDIKDIKYYGENLIIISTIKIIKIANNSQEIYPFDFEGMELAKISEDCRLVLVIAESQDCYSIKIYEIETGKCLSESNIEYEIIYVEFTSDSQMFSTLLENGQIKIWNTNLGKETITISAFSSHFRLNPNGYSLITSNKSSVSLWNIFTGEKISEFNCKGELIYNLSFNKDGSLIVVMYSLYELRIWNSKSGKCERIFNYDYQLSENITFSPDSTILACASEKSIHLWDLNSENRQTLEGHTDFICLLLFSNDGSILASGSDDCSIIIWDVKTGLPINQFKGHKGYITNLSFNQEGTMIASSDWKNNIHLWNLKIQDSRRESPIHLKGINCITNSRDGSFFISAGEDCSVKMWNTSTGDFYKEIKSPEERKKINCIDINSTETLLAAGTDDYKVLLWLYQTGESFKTILCEHFNILIVKFSPTDEHLLVIGTDNNRIIFLNLNDSNSMGEYKDLHEGAIESLQFSPNGRILISGADDRKICIWNTDTYELINVITDHEGAIFYIACDYNNFYFASGDSCGSIFVCDLNGNKICSYSKHNNCISVISFNKRGNLLASADWEGGLFISDSNTSETVHELIGHKNKIRYIEFTEKYLISGGEDFSLIFWNFQTGTLVYKFNTIGIDFCLSQSLLISWTESTMSLINLNFNNPSSSEFVWVKGKFSLTITNSSFIDCKFDNPNNRELLQQILGQKDD